MANRAGNRGLMFLAAEKHIGKRDKFIESEIALWIEAILEDCLPPKPFDELLKDGVILCRVMNVLKPGSVAKIKKPFTKDACHENLSNCISAIQAFGIPEDKLFTVEDIIEGQGIPKVVNCFLAIGRKCYEIGWDGPSLGPKPTGHLRNWTEQQLRAGEAIVPLQHGTNKFASQKGYRFGGQRDLLPHVKEKTTPTNNPRNWTEEQLRASEAIVPLQHGTNKFASQKGIRFGGQRDLLPHVKEKTTPTNNPRNWTEEQLRASEAIIPLQYGTNKLASQKGIRFGAQRDILPDVKDKTIGKGSGEIQATA